MRSLLRTLPKAVMLMAETAAEFISFGCLCCASRRIVDQ
jgi:hypothetical protein